MPAIYLPRGSIMTWKSIATPANPTVTTLIPTEHNRGALSIDVERIEKKNRMANGTMRKWFIADKKTWSTSWSMLPHSAAYTVDLKPGGSEMETFYFNNNGQPFQLLITNPDKSVNTYTVVFSNFNKSIEKRGKFDFWSLSIAMEEV